MKKLSLIALAVVMVLSSAPAFAAVLSSSSRGVIANDHGHEHDDDHKDDHKDEHKDERK